MRNIELKRGLRLSTVALGAIALALGLSGCSGRAQKPAAKPAIHFDEVSTDPVANGKRLASVLGCGGCHNPELTGNSMIPPQQPGTFWSANLTVAAHELTDQQLKTAIGGGMGPKRPLWMMPSFSYSHLSDGDLNALLAYFHSLPPKGEAHPEPVFPPDIKKLLANGTIHTSAEEVKTLGPIMPADAGPDYALGRYIVRSACAHCHHADLRGGDPVPGGAPGEKFADLRVAAAYDDADFKRLLRTGVGAGGRKLGLMSETAKNELSPLTDHEIAAIHAYLKKLAEIDP